MSANFGDQRNWIEKISSKIPGYGGYVEKERRRDTDKLQREHLADRLRGLKAPLNDIMQDMSSSGRLFEVTPVDRLIKKLDKLENRIRFATYGYSGFFDVVKVDQARLDAIYSADLGLVQLVDNVEAAINQLKGQYGTADGLNTGAAQVDASFDQLERAFDARHDAVNTFSDAAPQGPPFFNPSGQ